MLRQLLHRVVAQPWVYDLCQRAVGARYVRRRLANRIAPCRSAAIVLDVGGGTGATRKMWSPGSRYICLDLDPVKLKAYLAKNGDGQALLADATAIPVAGGSVDAVVCSAVTHHLTDPLLERTLSECARVLKPSGRLFLLDAIWAPWRPAGRLLWRYDRGSHPRTADQLQVAVSNRFEIEHWERFALWHAYVSAVARPAHR